MAIDTTVLYKLMILYMLGKVDFPLTNAQILDFFTEKEYTNYFVFQQCINELEESDFVFSDTIRNASYYHLTSEGRQTLQYFGKRLSPDIIDDIDTYLMRNKYQLREEVGTLSDYYFRPDDNDYMVHCQVKEGNSTLIEINVSVPTKDEAAFMCDRWKDESAGLYQYIFARLLRKEDEADADEVKDGADDAAGNAKPEG